ncbi:unnamed protein product [Timema podura]|uniref:Uncharacterized protein n=1 Tax=Timema podura TaxID=61482 RepID=A0ABN7NX34_TIMPD|nr:unnamed protein product [Timema podura]
MPTSCMYGKRGRGQETSWMTQKEVGGPDKGRYREERRELEKTDVILKPLVEIALEMSRLRESTGRQDPTVIT